MFAFSPWTDLAMTGDSLTTNEGRDPLLPVRRMPDLVSMVLGGMDPRDPRISPLYAEFDRPPPVLLQVGSVEILLDDSCRMAEVLTKEGGSVRVTVWSGCPHGWQLLDGYLPEARQALMEVLDEDDAGPARGGRPRLERARASVARSLRPSMCRLPPLSRPSSLQSGDNAGNCEAARVALGNHGDNNAGQRAISRSTSWCGALQSADSRWPVRASAM